MRKFSICALVLLFQIIAYGQEKDSVKTYNLEEITVKSGIIIEPNTTTELTIERIKKSNADNIYDLAKYIPSIKFQTNSRGESLFYIRGAGKRQTTVFFDGIPLNNPWDNRIDLSLIPTLAIGNFSVIKGMPSITFGANTPAGVVTIYSKEQKDDFSLLANLASGSDNYKKFELQSGFKLNKFSIISAVSYNEKGNFRLPSEFASQEEQLNNKRLNTDHKGLNFYGKVNYLFSQNSDINFSIVYSDAEKGIAPELDVTKPRYWRYPVWRRLAISLFGSNKLFGNPNNLISYSIAYSKFDQQIDEFTDSDYNVINDIEKDNNNTFYGRVLFTSFLSNSSLLKLSANGYTTIHDEKYLKDNYVKFRYSQNLFSFGAEYEYLTKKSTLIFGAAYDISSTPETGGKPHSSAQGAVSLNTSFLYKFNKNISTRINIGRKTRFASLREAYSGALGRFVLNPNLKPEIITSLDGGIIVTNDNLNFEANLFYTLFKDGIVRQSLPERKFMRINKDEIRIYGTEFIFNWGLNESSSISFNLTLMNSRGKSDNGNFTDTLEYKPSIISSAIWDYNPIEGFNIFTELKFISEEYGLKDGSVYYQKLPEYTLVNMRFSYTTNIYINYESEFYFRINNLFDKLYYPQWGLPDPGREFLGGIKFNF